MNILREDLNYNFIKFDLTKYLIFNILNYNIMEKKRLSSFNYPCQQELLIKNPYLKQEIIPNTFRMNRNGLLKNYLINKNWREAKPHEYAKFSQLDTIGKGNDIINSEINSEIKCFPRSATNYIDNPYTFFKSVEEIGLVNKGFPEIFYEWRNLDKDTINSSPIWFLKYLFNSFGKGIHLIGGWEDYNKFVNEIPKRKVNFIVPSGKKIILNDLYILQRGLYNCHLYKKRKYILRVYCLIKVNGSVFIYDDALGYAHSREYNPNDKDWDIQVSHSKNKKGQIYFTLSNESFGKEIMEKIKNHTKEYLCILKKTIINSQSNPNPEKRINNNHYHLWGMDYLVCDTKGDLSVWLIEFNSYPNMNHHNPRKGEKVQQNELDFRKDFDRDLMRRLGLEKQDNIKNKWIEIIKPYPTKKRRKRDLEKEKNKF